MSSSSSFSSRNWLYEVFPSFSGEDIRENFLSHFLKELNRKLITAFKDNEIDRGRSLNPELNQAIRDSKIVVVVFSKRYVSSSWCLNELLEIVKCQEEFGQTVIPIFYGLEPSDVRKQTGEFGNIFKETCKNKTEEVKNQWKKALTHVSNILGHHIRNCDNEAATIERIVDDISKRLYGKPYYDFEDFPGLSDHITKMNIMLDLKSKGVKMVGIWGPPGIGKSTIARALYSKLSLEFQGSIYINRAFIYQSLKNFSGGVKDDYDMKLHMQSRFLSKLLNINDLRVDNLGAVSQKLSHLKVLVVIDDLDQMMVLETLAKQTQWFGKGSRIIVVTNDNHLLRAHGIDCVYNVDLASEELAIQILCKSAFQQNSPPTGFEELVVEVARCAGNLTLGLTVLGAYLRGRDKEEWMDLLPSFQSGIDGKIEKILGMSYDGLREKEQDLFRHIACLFNLEKVSDIKLLLADTFCDFNILLQRLLEKSLLHIRLGIVEMNVLLQELGKAIVRGQSMDPGKREFLVDPKDILDVLKYGSGTGRVLGISLDIDKIDDDELYIHESAFEGMYNLRFLNIFSSEYLLEKRVRLHLPDSFDYLPPKLRLLCWDSYPMKTMPSNFNPEKLIKLKMKNSKLKKLWEGTRPLRGLKEINLWGSENLTEIPNLSMATNLEKLYIENRLSWVEVPSSIRKFNQLADLGMLECRNLETLPTGSNLESPKGLMISLKESSRLCLEKVVDIFRMESLRGENRWLGMQALIRMVTTLPDSLTVLVLSNIPTMAELPSSIKNLKKLTDLRILRCTNLVTLPTGINLESLERLNLNGCSRLRTFPDISRNISSLYLEETAIEEVPRWIENFSNLKYLIMKRCSRLEYVYLNLSNLKHLELVNFSYCGALNGVDLTGYLSGMAIEADNIYKKLPVLEEASTSLPDNDVLKVDFSFIGCPNLEQEALLQQFSFEKCIMSGEKMPSYFTHQSTGTSLAISLLEAPLPRAFFRFKACAVVCLKSKPTFGAIGVSMKVNCRFKDRLGNQIDSPNQQDYFSLCQKGSHLFILDCCFPLNKEDAFLAEVSYNHVDIKLHVSSGNSKFELKGWGIRLSEDCSSAENRLGYPITLPRLCEADGDNMDNN